MFPPWLPDVCHRPTPFALVNSITRRQVIEQQDVAWASSKMHGLSLCSWSSGRIVLFCGPQSRFLPVLAGLGLQPAMLTAEFTARETCTGPESPVLPAAWAGLLLHPACPRGPCNSDGIYRVSSQLEWMSGGLFFFFKLALHRCRELFNRTLKVYSSKLEGEE